MKKEFKEPAHTYLRDLGKKTKYVFAVLYSQPDTRYERTVLIIEKMNDKKSETDCRFVIFRGKRKSIIWFSGDLARSLASWFPEATKRANGKRPVRRGKMESKSFS